jgi:hypothetical protein
MNVRESNPKLPSYARKAAAKATPNNDATEETANEEAPLELPELPVDWGPAPLLLELPLGRGVEEAGELEEEGKAVAAAA